MANPRGNVQNLRPAWRKGESGNPGGKPIGARNRLQAAFLRALLADFRAHGPATIERYRQQSPGGYLRLIASLLTEDQGG